MINHSVHNPPKQMAIFTINQVKTIISHVENTYLAHYSLYYNMLINNQKNEEINFNLIVDIPRPLLPLEEALPMGKEYNEIPDDSDDKKIFVQQLQEVKKKQAQKD